MLAAAGAAIAAHEPPAQPPAPPAPPAPSEVAPIQPVEGEAQPTADPNDDEIQPFPLPDLAPPITQLLDQAYLTEPERRDIRIRHGVWEAADLSDPASTARAALLIGALSDPALADPQANPLDRAEASIKRGNPRPALDLLTGIESLRAARLRAQALTDLGQTQLAIDALQPLIEQLTSREIVDADELVEGVRGLLIVTRLRGEGDRPGTDYRASLSMLAKARDQLDRLSWNATLAEAQLLYEKDNYREAGQALETTLRLNPSCADAWFLLGRITVDGFDFPQAESVAARLDTLAQPAVSPYAGMIRAAVRLRQNEGEAAEQQLAPVLASYPDMRPALALHAAAAAGRFDFDQAQRRLDAFDALSPQSPDAYLAVGKAMASARQYEEAARFLKVAADRAPNWPEPIIELGLSQLQAGNNDAAFDALEKAAGIDVFNVRAANSLTLLNDLRAYAWLESDHFIVRYKPGVDEVLAREMLEPLESIFTRVTGSQAGGIDHAPAHKTVVEVYPDHRTFGVRITGMPQLHTIAAATGPVIAMEAPREGPGHFGTYNWARVVQHEYTHTVTLSRTKNRLPHWFTEASAVYLEDSPRDYNAIQLLTRAYETDTLFDLDTINIMFVRPKRPSDRSQAYAQGHWMYTFIVERFGQQKPLELMDVYATGVREAAAFQSILGVSREQFLAQFKVWAHQQLMTWGMAPTPQSPDLETLLAAQDQPAPADPAEAAASTHEPDPEVIETWVTAHPGNPFVLEAAIRNRLFDNRGKPSAADIPLLEDYAIARPVDPLPHKLLATLYLEGAGADLGRGPEAAIEHLEYLDAREQNSAGFATELARQYAALGDLDKAAAKAQRATQIAPYDAPTREFAATIALRRKDYKAAERHISALTMIEPTRPIHQERLEALRKLRNEQSK